MKRSTVVGVALCLLAAACQRKDNNPLLATPGVGVSGVTLAVRGVDNSNVPNVKVLVQPRTDLGAAITDLALGNFGIVQDGQYPVVPISYGAASGYPFSVMLVIDHSGSMSADTGAGQTRLEAAQAAAETFLNSLSADDEAAFIEYDDTVNFVHAFTKDKSSVITAVYASTYGGATATFDALVSGAEELSKGTGLRLLVFLTDGDDNSSSNTAATAKQRLLNVGAVACGIVIGGGVTETATLQDIADSTGGQLLTGTTQPELQTAFNNILTSGLFDDIYALEFRRKSDSPDVRVYVTYGSLTDSVDLQNFR